MTEDLTPILDEIKDYMESNGMKPFFGLVSKDYDIKSQDVVVWDPRNGDWRAFIEVAKNEGVKTVIVDTYSGSAVREGKLGYFRLGWLREHRLFIFAQSASWWSGHDAEKHW
jgi:hypothetical protein